MDQVPSVSLSATHIYTDASRNIGEKTSPSLGILFPSEDWWQVGADSLPFPMDFLLKANGTCFVANTSSTLEALGILIPLMIDPHRCVGRDIRFHIDNLTVVCAFKKRRSNDRLAHTVIRAAYLVV